MVKVIIYAIFFSENHTQHCAIVYIEKETSESYPPKTKHHPLGAQDSPLRYIPVNEIQSTFETWPLANLLRSSFRHRLDVSHPLWAIRLRPLLFLVQLLLPREIRNLRHVQREALIIYYTCGIARTLWARGHWQQQQQQPGQVKGHARERRRSPLRKIIAACIYISVSYSAKRSLKERCELYLHAAMRRRNF